MIIMTFGLSNLICWGWLESSVDIVLSRYGGVTRHLFRQEYLVVLREWKWVMGDYHGVCIVEPDLLEVIGQERGASQLLEGLQVQYRLG